MTPELLVIFSITIYKLSCLIVGSLFCVLGYRLFSLGIWGKTGDLNASFGNNKLVLKSAAPGTFFAVLGAGIIIGTIAQGINFDLNRDNNGTVLSTSKPPALPEPQEGGK